MWHILKSKGVKTTRTSVMNVVKVLDPEGVLSRRKKRLRRRCYSVPGPEVLWHIDGYDKLKPYEFSIHGCTDGFSGRIIWLKEAPSNKHPTTKVAPSNRHPTTKVAPSNKHPTTKVAPSAIASYYYSAVKEVYGVPTRIRSDDGTENSIIEPIKIFLRSAHDDEFAGLRLQRIDQCGGGSFLQNFRLSALLMVQGPLFKNACDFVSLDC